MEEKNLKIHKKVGRPSILNKELTLQIRSLYFSGLNIKNIQLELGINAKTWEGWYYEDIQGFRSKFNQWKQEKMIDQAETNLTTILEMETDDPVLLRLKLTGTIFALETLGKETYSKKILQEDPNAASRTEMDELRQSIKKMISGVREKNHTNFKEKTLRAVKL